jgi:DNA-directed RNA polymerase subunit RPC12/RpoP
MNGIEHPDITHARATGYPANYREPPPEPDYVFLCTSCGDHINEGDYYTVCEATADIYCLECTKEILMQRAYKFNF